MLIKLNTNPQQDDLIEKLKQHFGEATASKAVMSAFEHYLEVYELAEDYNAQLLATKQRLNDATHILMYQKNLEARRNEFVEESIRLDKEAEAELLRD